MVTRGVAGRSHARGRARDPWIACPVEGCRSRALFHDVISETEYLISYTFPLWPFLFSIGYYPSIHELTFMTPKSDIEFTGFSFNEIK